MKRALVTGSAGFIGKNLVEALQERGDEVVGVDIKTGKEAFHIVHQDGPFDEVYNLACVNQVAAEGDALRSRFVNGYLPIHMQALALNWGARFVHTSTASVYGQSDVIPTPVYTPVAPRTVYARDKMKGENLLMGRNAVILRLSNVYGPHQTVDNPYCGVVGRFVEHILTGKPLTIYGEGTQTRDFTYVDDVVEHLTNPALEPGVYNVSYGKETSIHELISKLMLVTGEKAVEIEVADPRPTDGIDRRCLISDLSCPTDLRDGLERTVSWVECTLEADSYSSSS